LYMIGLVEAGLVTLPEPLRRTKKAASLSRRYGVPPDYIILDVSLFHDEMVKLGISSRLGRPDIVHQFLLATQYSPLNAEGKLRTFIHTAEGHVIYVKPKTRIPKNYFQFVGLIQRLFIHGQVPPRGEWLMRLERGLGLAEALSRLKAEEPILLHEKGERLTCEVARSLKYPPFAFLVGGFPRGDFSGETIRLAKKLYSIKGGRPLDSWLVADRLIACLENEIL